MQLWEMWDELEWQPVWMHLLPAADVNSSTDLLMGEKNDDSQRCAVYENLISQLFLSPAGSSRLNELQERQD